VRGGGGARSAATVDFFRFALIRIVHRGPGLMTVTRLSLPGPLWDVSFGSDGHLKAHRSVVDCDFENDLPDDSESLGNMA
jgi:hypothetical protein